MVERDYFSHTIKGTDRHNVFWYMQHEYDYCFKLAGENIGTVTWEGASEEDVTNWVFDAFMDSDGHREHHGQGLGRGRGRRLQGPRRQVHVDGAVRRLVRRAAEPTPNPTPKPTPKPTPNTHQADPKPDATPKSRTGRIPRPIAPTNKPGTCEPSRSPIRRSARSRRRRRRRSRLPRRHRLRRWSRDRRCCRRPATPAPTPAPTDGPVELAPPIGSVDAGGFSGWSTRRSRRAWSTRSMSMGIPKALSRNAVKLYEPSSRTSVTMRPSGGMINTRGTPLTR